MLSVTEATSCENFASVFWPEHIIHTYKDTIAMRLYMKVCYSQSVINYACIPYLSSNIEIFYKTSYTANVQILLEIP